MNRTQRSESYNRIFILGARTLGSEDIENAFREFGVIKDVRILKFRLTGGSKGISYVTFEKASEAALAIEKMNGKYIGGADKPIKVLLANDRSEGNVRYPEEEDKMKRLFIIVPNEQNEESLKTYFKRFGDLEYVKMLPKNAKGLQLAYVKFYSAYHAALALEQCDENYRAKFAESWATKRMKSELPYKRDHSLQRDGDVPHGRRFRGDYELSNQTNRHRGGHVLFAQMALDLLPEQVFKLFDLQPGLEFCEYNPKTGLVHASYSDYPFAERARDLLKSFEYPPGSPIQFTDPKSTDYPIDEDSLKAGPSMDNTFRAFMQTIEKAAAAFCGTGYDGTTNQGQSAPDTQGHLEHPMVERVQFISSPNNIPIDALTNAFYRFENFLKVEYIPGTSFGMALFSSPESARRAYASLNGQVMFGNELKILPPPSVIAKQKNGLAEENVY